LWVVDVDPEFFAALASNGVCRGFAWLDVASDEVPAVGVVTASRVPMCHERVTISYEGRRSNAGNLGLLAHQLMLSLGRREFGHDGAGGKTVAR
jgi:hypothetical protein